ncbi:hypothetical protein K440DRAFT_565706 [Wilcoxina mikolae CBS 423.85]|nr:hypothetical protein K440DRAFT_565706 [Wilcoxina mikolae CBS 423.85]
MALSSGSPLGRLLILVFVSVSVSAPLTPPGWLKEIMPKKGTSLYSEIHCYALPYGAIGFLSHILTYYTIIVLSLGRSPLRPWKRLNSPKLDMFLALTGLLIGVILTIFSMVRCRQRWQFLLIAIWKAMLSITLGALSVHAAAVVRRAGPRKHYNVTRKDFVNILRWLLLYLIGSIIGCIGLAPLVIVSYNDNVVVMRTTVIFGYTGMSAAVMILFAGGIIGHIMGESSKQLWKKIFLPFACIGVTLGAFTAFYSDWILAGLAENLIGVPTGDNAVLYFLYFAAKRLSIFSI